MSEILSTILKILFIVFFFGFCVFIHEFGHLLVALWQGLHVEKFSIGMGPRLCGFRYRGVEYIVSWLPFGGYVSLPQLDPTDAPVTSEDRPLPPAKPLARALTAFAGPFFNVLFGFFLATIMWMAGLWRPTPSTSVMVAGLPAYLPHSGGVAPDARILAVDGAPMPEVEALTWWEFCYRQGEEPSVPSEFTLTLQDAPDSPAREVRVSAELNEEWKAGLRPGDRIVAVNGKTFQGGEDEFQKEYVYGNTGHVTLSVIRDGHPMEFRYSPQKNPAMEGLGFPFFDPMNPVQLAEIAPGSPAEAAGLRSGDQLLAFAGKNILGPGDFLKRLPEYAGQQVPVVVSRDGKELPAFSLQMPSGKEISDSDLGISFYVLVTGVIAGTPAEQAGIRYGDRFTHLALLDEAGAEVSRTQVRDVQDFRDFVRSSHGAPIRVTYRREGKERTAVMKPYEDPQTPGAYVIGVIITGGLPKTLLHVSPWTQFSEVIGTTLRTLGLLFTPVTSRARSMVTGQPREVSRTQIGVRHMSGPLGIVQALWYKLKIEGYRGGFSFIILITFSLAFMNLLPMPVLDGGHIVFAAIEGVTRRRIPVTFFKYIYNAFAVLLIGLMLYITLFDGRRILQHAGITGTKVKTTAPEVQSSSEEMPPEASSEEFR